MKYLITTLVALLFFQSNSAQKFDLKDKKQQVEWTGKAAFKAYSLTGTLNVEKGAIEIIDNTITKLEIAINMKSLDHENGDLKSHLRGTDFFNVNRYKKATFKLSKPVILEKESTILTGMMIIKEKRHKENIKVTILQSDDNLTLSFDHTMDRTTYGVKYNSPSFFKSLKQNAIADEFTLKGNLRFEKVK